ncbi:MAG: hypothetical protein HYZ11_00455 [Candidatus Tectomicrobia bacterium]|uniref:Uncharacterized protein n=1 Tax=Tectimicrobiota bacterium TaxID=2528274 RepID=A0A932HUT5_UNCTE|nr:hypothetical protein [Candidatus Tectomicrobia bacterium]
MLQAGAHRKPRIFKRRAKCSPLPLFAKMSQAHPEYVAETLAGSMGRRLRYSHEEGFTAFAEWFLGTRLSARQRMSAKGG